jgi:hypothetical protein
VRAIWKRKPGSTQTNCHRDGLPRRQEVSTRHEPGAASTVASVLRARGRGPVETKRADGVISGSSCVPLRRTGVRQVGSLAQHSAR